MRRIVVAAVFTVVGAGCGGEAPTSLNDATLAARAPQAVLHAPVCPGPARAADARCHARVVTDEKGSPSVTSSPTGLAPADIQAAYALPADGGAGQVIAIVDAYDHPNAENDLNVYRAQFGLAPCTTANGCFRKVNQAGVQGNYPRSNQGWALEISLDLAMASASCPACGILLVEASSNSLANLGAAVNTAVALGATVVSNSYGGSEFAGELAYESTYLDHPGVAITASSGDNGYGVSFPAASRFVTAVGGTRLVRDASARGFTERAWSGAGSGCSGYVAKPSWQTDASCVGRAVADVSAVADPSTGVAVYDSYGYKGQRGWFVVGGTSASAPIIAGVYALAGNASGLLYGAAPYASPASLFDVVGGSNGACGMYLCTAVSGYDGPTGLGTPNGTAAF